MAVVALSPGTTGSHFNTARVLLTNRVGAATVIGGVYMLDLARTQGESTTPETACENVTPITTAGFYKEIVVAADVIADNARGFFILAGGSAYRTKLLVNANSVNIAAGDSLKPVNASTAAVKGTPGTDPCFAVALTAATTDGVLIDAIVYGRGLT